MSRNEFAARFERMADDALLKRYGSGDLTDEAQAVAGEEIRRRGLELPRPEPAASAAAQGLSGDLVNVAGYLTLPEAQVLQALLESEGIPALLADAHVAQAIFPPLGAQSGARLMVHEQNAGRALEIKAALKNGEYELGEDDEFDGPFPDEAGGKA